LSLALVKGAVGLGLDEKDARFLACQSALGAAHLALHTDVSLDKLKAQVTSSGGTTEAGLKVLDSYSCQAHFVSALEAANARAGELAKIIGKEEV